MAVGFLLAIALGVAFPLVVGGLLDASRAEAKPPGPRGHEWLTDLTNSQIRFPAKDAFGRKISERGPRLFIALSCAGCSTKQFSAESLEGPKGFEPTVVAFEARREDVPPQFSKASNLRILCYPETGTLPPSIFMSLPQAFELDRAGMVVRTPKQDQDVEEFVASVRGKK